MRDERAGVVAAGHPHTARAGAWALASGGNAVDAVVAAALAAMVAESPLTGPAAGGFLLMRDPDGHATLLDFFVASPGRGPHGRALDPERLDHFTVPFGGADQVFHIGHASVGVPGMVPGLCRALRRGSMTMADLVEPAVRLARQGVQITESTAFIHRILHAMLNHTPASAAMFCPAGRELRAGEILTLPDLGETLMEIARCGDRTFRDGPLADLFVGEMERGGGLVTAEDLAAYEVVERAPLSMSYRGATILTNPPPSSGGVLIAAALEALEDGPPAGGDVPFYRGVADAARQANALRAAGLLDGLHDQGFLPRFRDALAAQRSARRPVGSTTHVSVIDGEGGMASLSSSCGSGSGVVVPGTGVLLNNMLGEEDLNPGGFGRWPAGERLTSMMAPSLVIREGEPFAAVGSAGSNRLRSAILQSVVSLLDGGLSAQAAVDRPRVHHEGGGLDVEAGVPEHAVRALEQDGHALRRWRDRNLFFGGVSMAVLRDGAFDGAGDPRRGGGAVAVTRAGEIVDLQCRHR